jgi:hypothetical protein
MFFVSEEFLRKYEEEEGEVEQTIGDAVPIGEELFENTGGKREYNIKSRKKSETQGSEQDVERISD